MSFSASSTSLDDRQRNRATGPIFFQSYFRFSKWWKGLLSLRPITMIPRIFLSHFTDLHAKWNWKRTENKSTPWLFIVTLHCYYICWSLFAFPVLVSLISFWCLCWGFFALHGLFFLPFFLGPTVLFYLRVIPYCTSSILVFSHGGFLVVNGT